MRVMGRARRLAVLVAAAGFVLSFSGAAFADAQSLLLKTAKASRATTYQGVVIYRSGNRIESLRLLHALINGQERERISALTGEMREVIREDDRVICLMPQDRKANFSTPPLKGLLAGLTPQSLQQMQQWYAVNEIGSARIAGRSCRGVEFAPRDRLRYRFQIWSDEATSVPLRVALIGLDGQVLEEVMFTEVNFPESLPAKAFEPEGDPARYRSVPTPPAQQTAAAATAAATGWDGFPVRLATSLPGYQVTARDRRPARNGKAMVEHLMLSDGLSAISIFATPSYGASERGSFTGLTQRGGVHAYGRRVGIHHVTVVGETPAAAVRLVAEGLQAVEAPAAPVATPPGVTP